MEPERTFVRATGHVVEVTYDAAAHLYAVITYAGDRGHVPGGRPLAVRYCTSANLPALHAAAVAAAGGTPPRRTQQLAA